MIRRIRNFVLLALALSGFVSSFGKIRVVASTSQIADIVRAVGGDTVDLTVLMGPGVDPHLYKATARDVVSLQRAKLILYNGLHLEGRLAEVFAKVSDRGLRTIAVAERIPKDWLLASENYADAHDPHVWFDPDLWDVVVGVVAEALAEVDPDNTAAYQSRGEAYRDQVRELGRWARARIASIPKERRVLITSHDAYNYFGRAFEFQVVGVQGVSTATEAGLADIANMADFIKERGIPAIFVESSVSPATIKRISRDSGATVGGELFSDALGALGELHEGADGEKYDVGTYLGMFKYNVDTIVQALAP